LLQAFLKKNGRSDANNKTEINNPTSGKGRGILSS
jgi:hypothetical protein